MSSLLPEDLHSQFILSSLPLVLCRVAVVRRLRIYHHSADYDYGSFWVIGIILGQSANRVLLKPVLGACAVLHHYITANEQTQYNRVCYFRFFDVFFVFKEFSFRTYFTIFEVDEKKDRNQHNRSSHHVKNT